MTSSLLPIGATLSERYRIDAFIAEGGMAIVYRAHDLRLERDVAIKVVRPEIGRQPDYLENFLIEARLAAKVSHANLVNVFDQGLDGSLEYLVMELVEGKTLREVLTKFGRIEQSKALDVTASILAGASALHRAGIVHRDIKPENVILANDGRIKLTDFGLARPTSQDPSGSPLYGTVAYMAPEILRGEQIDARSDIYAIGITLFELLTGSQPFKGDDAKAIAKAHLATDIPMPSSLASGISPSVDSLVQRASSKLPQSRFESASEMLQAVKTSSNSIRGTNPTVRLEPAPTSNPTELISSDLLEEHEEAPRPPRRFVKWLAMTAAAIVLGTTFGWWFGTGPGALITVPDLVSMAEIDARGATSQLPIKFESVDEYSDKAKGTVIRTDPPAGSYLMRDGSLKVYLSMGPKLNTVPNLLGKNLAEATLTLRGVNLWVGAVESFFNDAALGTVYDYSGSDGTSYPDGSKIDLKVSLGPIPMVQGVSKEVATTLLTAAGLKVGKITESYSDTVAKGQIISFVPQSADLAKGGSVDLTVSKGSDKVIMPKVVGETIAASKLALENLGLRVIVDTNQLTSKWGVAKVKSASAPAGSTLRIGDSVTIVSR